MTPVFQIALPDVPNNFTLTLDWAQPYSETNPGYGDERDQWSRYALENAGGFTYLGTRRGSWIGDDGKVYDERMHWYEVATTHVVFDDLIGKAFELFPDQKAFYTAQVGTADIVERALRDVIKGAPY